MRPGGISPNPELSESEILKRRDWVTEYNELHKRFDRYSDRLFLGKIVVGAIGLVGVLSGLYMSNRHTKSYESQTPTIVAAEATSDTLRWTRNATVDTYDGLPASVASALAQANNERQRTISRLETRLETLENSPEYHVEKKLLADTDPSTTFVFGGMGLLALFGLADTFGKPYLRNRRLELEKELMQKYY